ncbi:MAG: DUF6722 family protein [Candidatus Scalindua sp.]
MKWFSNKGAKDNVSKYFYDISKIIVGTAVIAPFIGDAYKVKPWFSVLQYLSFFLF